MPIYEYKCLKCGYRDEKLLPRMEGGLVFICPECNKQMERKMSAVNWSFGWRLTDRSLYGGKGDPRDEYERNV